MQRAVEKMPAGQLDRRDRNQRRRGTAIAPHHLPVLDSDAVVDPRVEREVEAPRPRFPRQRQRAGIVGVDHRPVLRGLIGENARLGRCVLRKRRVTIEMVGRQVQSHRDPRMKRRCGLELKAADFDDMQRLRPRQRDLSRQRRAEVAAGRGGEPRFLEHPRGERGRRRLALGARDGDHAPGQPPRSEFDLADDRHAGPLRRGDGLLIRRNARAQHHEIAVHEGVGAMRPGFEADAPRLERGGIGNHVRGIGKRHPRAARHQQLGGSPAAPAGADDNHVLVLDVEAHRITSASMSSD